MALQTDIRTIKGIGDIRAKALSKLQINTLGDLIAYFPRTYDDRREAKKISDLTLDESATVCGTVASEPRTSRIRKGLEITKVPVVDETGRIEVVFFNQSYRKSQLKMGETYAFYGKVSGTLRAFSMQNPIVEKTSDAGMFTGRIVPIYRLTQGVFQAHITNAMAQALDASDGMFPDHLPPAVRQTYGLCDARFAYRNIHFPESEESLEIARRRLIFEELFLLTTALQFLKDKREVQKSAPIPLVDIAPFLDILPFQLTGAQVRAIDETLQNMAKPQPMSRLVQGDVGSGKTVVAAAAAWAAFLGGYQTAFMVPTEILAEQHKNTLDTLLAPLGVRVGLLTGSQTAKQKRETIALIQSGHYHVIVGTHALLSDIVTFERLGLVVADEQHRFGVSQRAALSEKGDYPHVLIMSATPIPRTLALIVYGDLDVSVIDERPPGRQVIDTFLVDDTYRPRLYAFIRKLLDEGRQAYVVCPAIESDPDDPTGGLKAVEAYKKELETSVFPDKNVQFLHGKQKAKDKEKTMQAFSVGEIDLLVSTTVIEVGVDVPNAALMVIENAEQFGLSQLHQLRGRVGRGMHKSYCVLVSSHPAEQTRARLTAFCKTNDGFEIAEEDLAIRGPGDFFGERQHGLPQMQLANLSTNMDVLKDAQQAAFDLLAADSSLVQPAHQALREKITQLFTTHTL